MGLFGVCFKLPLWQASEREASEQPKELLYTHMNESADFTMPDQFAVVGVFADPERTQELAKEITRVLRDHLAVKPQDPARFTECLNALAINASLLIFGSCIHGAADIFSASLDANFELYCKAQEDAQEAEQ